MRYASVIIGILVILILVGVAVAFMRSNNGGVAYGNNSYGANTYGNVAANQVACPQQTYRPVQTVQTIPVYQTAAPCAQMQTVPVYQAAAYQTVPAAYYPTYPTYQVAANTCPMTCGGYYPTMSAYYPMGAQYTWYTAPSQGYYGPNTRTVIYQSPGYQYDYQYQYQNTQVIPGQNQGYYYSNYDGGWYK